MEYFFVLSGLYLCVFALIMATENIMSAVVFKIVPGLIGVVLLYNALSIFNF